jgi:formiminotetrahydrofolate cyclodeaminase
MESPIAGSTIRSFRDHIAMARDPIAGGVAVAAVSGGLGLALLTMTLQVASRRKSLAGSRARIKTLLAAANKESRRLLKYADRDTAAYRKYSQSLKRKRRIDAALRGIIETPLEAAGAAVCGLDLCAEAIGLVPRPVASDVRAAEALLAGAARAILLTVDVNLGELPATSKLRRELGKKRRELEGRLPGR